MHNLNKFKELLEERALASKTSEATYLRCLPSLYLAGVNKAGTTDMYETVRIYLDFFGALRIHPMYDEYKEISGHY